MTSDTLASGTEICPGCGKAFDTITLHWVSYPGHRPRMSQHQHDIVFGLILGGSSIHTGNKTPSLEFRTQRRRFAVWVAESLGWLFGSLRRVPPMTDRGKYHAYVPRTKAHPGFERYVPWYDDGGREIPTSREIRRLAARAWYAKAAVPSWSGEGNTRGTQFSAAQEPKKSWVGAFLRTLGHDPTYRGTSWMLTTAETHDLIRYVGGPVPGAEYKWALDRDTYERLQNEHRERLAHLSDMHVEPSIDIDLYAPGEYELDIPPADPILDESTLGKEFSRQECIRAIRKAGGIVDEPLTLSRYKDIRPLLIDAPSSSLIVERFGWRQLLFEAAGRDGGGSVAWDTWEIAATLGQFCERTDKPWTRSKYERFKQEQSRRYPSVSTIQNEYGGWDTALKNLAAIGVVPSKPDGAGPRGC